jgi:hypothetical protein
MSVIFELHRVLANTLWMFYLLVAAWGIYRAIRGQAVDGSYFGAVAVVQIVMVIEVLLGATIFLTGARAARMFVHFMYATFAIVFLPGLFAYLKGDDSNRAQWIYALGALFMFGVTLRLISTAG